MLANVSITGQEQSSAAVTTESLLNYLEGNQDYIVYSISTRLGNVKVLGLKRAKCFVVGAIAPYVFVLLSCKVARQGGVGVWFGLTLIARWKVRASRQNNRS